MATVIEPRQRPTSSPRESGERGPARELLPGWRPEPQQARARPSMAGRPHPEQPRRDVGPAGRVIVIGVVCFGLWLLLAAPALRREAETSPLGARRSVSLAVLGPISRLSSVLGMSRLSSGAESILQRTHHHRLGDLTALPPSAFSPSPPVSARAGPVVEPSAERPTGGTFRFDGLSSASPPPVLDRPTKADPLRVLAVGDSIGADVGQGVLRVLSGRRTFVASMDAHEATGLARLDYFDWPSQLAADIGEFRPDVVVAMFGANDAQSIWFQGHWYAYGTAAWQSAYRQRVAQVMAEATSGGRVLIWVGMPPMASNRLTDGMQLINHIVATEAPAHPGVVYVDSWSLLADDGGYAAYLRTPSGTEQLVREPDGVHLSAAGSDRVAERVFQAMTALWSGTG
jgi:hypothetical protein